MPAYWIAHSKINDPVEYKSLHGSLPELFKKHGAKILARGGRYKIMEGPSTFTATSSSSLRPSEQAWSPASSQKE